MLARAYDRGAGSHPSDVPLCCSCVFFFSFVFSRDDWSDSLALFHCLVLFLVNLVHFASQVLNNCNAPVRQFTTWLRVHSGANTFLGGGQTHHFTTWLYAWAPLTRVVALWCSLVLGETNKERRLKYKLCLCSLTFLMWLNLIQNCTQYAGKNLLKQIREITYIKPNNSHASIKLNSNSLCNIFWEESRYYLKKKRPKKKTDINFCVKFSACLLLEFTISQ